MKTIGQLIRRYRQAAGLSLNDLAARVNLDKGNLSRLENDRQGLTTSVAKRLDEVLATGGALTAVTQGAAATASPDDDGIADAAYVQQLREKIAELVMLDGHEGGGALADCAVAHFTEANGRLAKGLYRPQCGRDLESATAEMGELAAWLLYDGERQQEARRINLEALHVARLCGHWSLELFILTNMSMLSVHTGNASEALKIARTTMQHRKVPARVVTLLRIREARALALLGHRYAAIAAMDRARADLTDSTHATDPPWTWWLTLCEHGWHDAMMYASLDDWHRAVEGFSTALELGKNGGHTPRGLYVHRAYLLDALVRVGDWHEAEGVAIDLLPWVGQVDSRRPAPLLRGTLAIARRSGPTSTVDDVLTTIAGRLSGVGVA